MCSGAYQGANFDSHFGSNTTGDSDGSNTTWLSARDQTALRQPCLEKKPTAAPQAKAYDPQGDTPPPKDPLRWLH